MRRHALIMAALLGGSIVAVPVLSQDIDLVRDQDGQPSSGADRNRGRFIAFGGLHGEIRVSCAQCHGMEGVGNSSGAFPRLADQSAWYLAKTLQDYASGLRHNEIMSPIARMLNPQQMQDVAAYFASVGDAPYPPRPEVDMQTLQIGRAIATVGAAAQGVPACDGCHGPDGVGQPPIYPYLAGQYAPYTEYQLMLWKQGRRDGDPMNVMELIAKAMTSEQIRAVSLYYANARPTEVTPGEGQTVAGAPLRSGIPAIVQDRALSGAAGNPERVQGGTVEPGAMGASRPRATPPYLTEPQPTRSGPNSSTTGQRPDPTR